MSTPLFRNALVSVSDKTGLVEFLAPYVKQGMRVVSTGGTLKHLRENGIQAVDITEQTGFPEVMDGRVKTLHPRVHMALLSRAGNHEDAALLAKEGLEPFDLLIVNLYPFASARKRGAKGAELIEYIDIGGPSLLRAAAKNHSRLAVVCEPEDYAWLAGKNELTLENRRRLAARVFAQTSRYDDLIAKTLATPEQAPLTLSGSLHSELRYGENPHQKAKWFVSPEAEGGLHEAEILNGKALSYNNILDLEAATSTVLEFADAAAVAVKHNNPCGVGLATSGSASAAVSSALLADPVSVFGAIVAVNREVDLTAAEEMSKIFLECVIAPSYSIEALARLQKKKDLRVLRWPRLAERVFAANENEFRSISGGFLAQTADRTSDWSADWKVVAADGAELTPAIKDDLLLAWKVCAHLKSNAIALVGGGKTLGLGMGQVNRVDAVEHAVQRYQKHHRDFSAPVLASDAFFPFADSVEVAAQAGVSWIIQPGGSIRDEEVLKRARELGVSMVLTGTRHFRH